MGENGCVSDFGFMLILKLLWDVSVVVQYTDGWCDERGDCYGARERAITAACKLWQV